MNFVKKFEYFWVILLIKVKSCLPDCTEQRKANSTKKSSIFHQIDYNDENVELVSVTIYSDNNNYSATTGRPALRMLAANNRRAKFLSQINYDDDVELVKATIIHKRGMKNKVTSKITQEFKEHDTIKSVDDGQDAARQVRESRGFESNRGETTPAILRATIYGPPYITGCVDVVRPCVKACLCLFCSMCTHFKCSKKLLIKHHDRCLMNCFLEYKNVSLFDYSRVQLNEIKKNYHLDM